MRGRNQSFSAAMIDRAPERIEPIHDPDPCPLCDRALAHVVEVISFEAIWRRLEGDFGVRFTANVKDEHTRGEFTTLVECANCGLRYFTPAAAGNSGFYRELMKGAHYEEDRWEFGRVASMLAPGVTVVDLGSGSGAFLRSLGNRAARRVAIDHNVDVAPELCQQEIEFRSEIALLATEQLETFDVICAFQLLEHLPSIAEVIEPARACLRPGGSLFVSVPNRERTRRPGLEPLDCPPHHISRWARTQFDVLAQRFDLQLHRVQVEPPTFSTICELRERAFELRLRCVLGPRARLGARVLRKLTLRKRSYERAVRSGRYARDGIFGHTMLAEFRRLTSAAQPNISQAASPRPFPPRPVA
jgi:2-polyprenyl-3-methyl-5-hydroxy-6-metoxy-1,4-benzoquinol methylase